MRADKQLCQSPAVQPDREHVQLSSSDCNFNFCFDMVTETFELESSSNAICVWIKSSFFVTKLANLSRVLSTNLRTLEKDQLDRLSFFGSVREVQSEEETARTSWTCHPRTLLRKKMFIFQTHRASSIK